MTTVHKPRLATTFAITALTIVAALIGGCTSSPEGTALRLRMTYDDAWSLSRLDVEAKARTQSASAARELLVRVPDDWAGAPLTVDVWGHRGQNRYAHGQVTLTPVLDQTVSADVVLARMPCGAWCTPGTTSCQGDTVVVCEQRDDDGCFEWSDPVACVGDSPFCSLGACAAECIDECGDGDTRCAGPQGLQICGNADSDPCNDWLPPVACGDGDTCSNGACSATCQDECAAGTKECLGAGTVTCGDLDGDGCLEWSPVTACGSGQSCTNGVCAAGCTDECSASSCSGLNFTACGQFDLDSCLDRSPGMSCVPSNACLEGSCAPATGCASAPKVCDMPPEAECINAGTLRTYAAQGTCSAGACDYMPTDIACPNCPACDACEGVTCNMPPAPTACYQPSGTCTDGSCSYAFKNNATCNDNDACTLNDTCASGVCSGTPKACTAPPPAMCLNTTTLRTYAPTGTCSAGTCAYGHTDSTCPNGCNAGACTQPAWIAITAGDSFSCAIRGNGTLECWGSNTFGESTPPTGTFKALSAGWRHACAIRTDGTIACWGELTYDRGDTPAGTFTKIAAGELHTCAIRTDGTLECWGSGGGSTAPSGAFTAIAAGDGTSCGLRDGVIKCWGASESPPTNSPYAALGLGSNHGCAVRSSGTVDCWGPDLYGEGDPPSGTFSAVDGGYAHSCGLRSDGRIKCWGDSNSPDGTFTALAVGTYHACGIRTDGALECWGNDDFGESSPPPTP